MEPQSFQYVGTPSEIVNPSFDFPLCTRACSVCLHPVPVPSPPLLKLIAVFLSLPPSMIDSDDFTSPGATSRAQRWEKTHPRKPCCQRRVYLQPVGTATHLPNSNNTTSPTFFTCSNFFPFCCHGHIKRDRVKTPSKERRRPARFSQLLRLFCAQPLDGSPHLSRFQSFLQTR